MFGEALKIIKLNSTTKKGYEISIIEAVEAPKLSILEKIKKLAKVAKTRERTMSHKFDPPIVKTSFTDSLLMNKKGSIIMAMIIESITRRVNGDTL